MEAQASDLEMIQFRSLLIKTRLNVHFGNDFENIFERVHINSFGIFNMFKSRVKFTSPLIGHGGV
jgi:hypothetical protein